MPHEDPLAYLVGLEGVALLRGFTEGTDAASVEARLTEVRRLLDDRGRLGPGVEVADADPRSGYAAWAPTYDDPGNGAFALEEPPVHAILDGLPPGDALDAACGTGRHTRRLAAAGHRVVGIDTSPDMLDRARDAVPGAAFREGTLDALPLDDDAVDLVVCALALAHLPDVAPVYAEFARVLRPGGHLVVSDLHPDAVLRGSQPPVRIGGRPARIRNHRHRTSDHLGPALGHGLQVVGCSEPRPGPPDPAAPAGSGPGPWETWPWSLAALVPRAAAAAWAGEPALVVWHFLRPGAR